MGRAEQILEIMNEEPKRTWHSWEIGSRLSIPTSSANEAMKRMANTRALVRVSAGQYCLPSRFDRAAAESTPKPQEQAAPLPPAAEERAEIVRVLSAAGRPLAASVLAAKPPPAMRRLPPGRVGEIAAQMQKDGELQRLPNGMYALPQWKAGEVQA